jgi:hypothetical protein
VNTLERLKALAGEAAAWITAGLPVVSTDENAARLIGCATCPHLTEYWQCGLCTCNMPLKSWIGTASCPDTPPRWNATVPSRRWFFGTEARRLALVAELESWAGTRFWRGTRGRAVKGVRADCVSFCEAVMVNLGAMKRLRWPAYVTNGGETMRQLLARTLSEIPKLVQVWEPGSSADKIFWPGDLLAGSAGDGRHHMGIYAGGNVIWHCTMQHGVCKGTLQDPALEQHLIGIYRFRV